MMKGLSLILIFLFSLKVFAVDTKNFCASSSSANKNTENLQNIFSKVAPTLKESRSYFQLACQVQKGEAPASQLVQISALDQKPNTDGLRTVIPLVDQQGQKTQDFLKKVYDKVKEQHDMNQSMATDIKTCSGTPALPKCKNIDGWMKNTLPQMAKIARFNLAMAPSTSMVTYLVGQGDQMNSQLVDQKYKFENWKALTPAEQTVAAKSFALLQRNAREAAELKSKNLSTNRKQEIYRQELLKLREAHQDIYKSFLGVSPILQYLKSADPSLSEIHEAAQKILKNLEEENENLDLIKAAMAKPVTMGRVGTKTLSPKVLDLMQYKKEVEEVLLENPEFCGIGLALHQIKDNSEITMALATVPLMVTSFFVPPVYSLAIGAATTGLYAYGSQRQLSEIRSREGARVMKEDPAVLEKLITDGGTNSAEIGEKLSKDVTEIYRKDLEDMHDSESNRDMAWAFVPVGFVSKSAITYARAYKINILKVFQKTP